MQGEEEALTKCVARKNLGIAVTIIKDGNENAKKKDNVIQKNRRYSVNVQRAFGRMPRRISIALTPLN